MCRYILAVPSKKEDQEHNIRIIFGNGLRPQIWGEFVKRFKISQVLEFYGATEGNANVSKYYKILSLIFYSLYISMHKILYEYNCINSYLILFNIVS